MKLMVYGELMQGKTGLNVQAAGELRIRENGDAAAKFGLDYNTTTVKGILITEEQQKIHQLDLLEKPEYKRTPILLTTFEMVDAYEYIGKAWDKFEVVPNGTWKPSFEKKTRKKKK